MAHQRAEHPDMAEIEMHIADPKQSQRLQHQLLDFQIAFQTAMPIQLGADLQQLAGARQPDRLGVQHAAGIAQPRHALTVEQMRIDARHLRRDVGAQCQGAPAQLIDQLEGAQIHVVAAIDQQRFGIFQQRRRDQLISRLAQQIEELRAHPFDAPCLVGQHVFYIFGKQPVLHRTYEIICGHA